MGCATHAKTTPDLDIRWARRTEAREIARLFLISSDGLAAYIWSRLAEPGQSPEDVGAARYARAGVAFSYANCLFAMRAGQVLGMLHAFPMDRRAPGDVESDPVLRPYAELEDPGSLYVSGIAVYARHRGKGVGSRLMSCARELAVAKGCPRVSLICFERNEAALGFYDQLGFRVADRRPIVPHPSLHYRGGDALMLAQAV